MKESIETEELSYYYLDMQIHLNRPKKNFHKLDENNILMYKIPFTQNFEYHPVSIMHYALANHQKFLETNKEEYLKKFLSQVKFLKKNLIEKNKYAVWEHNYKLPFHEFKKIPWVHGMVQGMGLSLLLRAYQINKERKYLDACKKIIESFKIDIKDGGIRYIDKKNDHWYEEYAILPPPHILNGFIYALFGVYDYYCVTQKEEVKKIWEKGIKTIENNLKNYDAGYWSYYSLDEKQPSSESYHKLHIEQLKALYKITKKEIFKKYYDRWKGYRKKPINRYKALIKRYIFSIKKHGIINAIKRYREMKKWEKKT